MKGFVFFCLTFVLFEFDAVLRWFLRAPRRVEWRELPWKNKKEKKNVNFLLLHRLLQLGWLLNINRRNKMSVEMAKLSTLQFYFFFHFCFGPNDVQGGISFMLRWKKGKLNFFFFFWFSSSKELRKQKQQNKRKKKKSKPSTNTSATANQQKMYKSKIKKKRREEEEKLYPSSLLFMCVWLTTNGSRS